MGSCTSWILTFNFVIGSCGSWILIFGCGTCLPLRQGGTRHRAAMGIELTTPHRLLCALWARVPLTTRPPDPVCLTARYQLLCINIELYLFLSKMAESSVFPYYYPFGQILTIVCLIRGGSNPEVWSQPVSSLTEGEAYQGLLESSTARDGYYPKREEAYSLPNTRT